MAGARVTRVSLNQGQINKLLRSPGGAVHREVSEHTRKVTNLAKQRAPVDTGMMRARISGSVEGRGNRVVGRVVADTDYAIYVHEGRGPVRAKRAKALRFRPKGGGAYIFRTSVGPAPSNPFLVDALEAGCPWPVSTSHRL